MNRTAQQGLWLEFQDSQVSGAQVQGDELRLVLSSAHVSGPAGGSAQAAGEMDGYLAPLALHWRGARWQGELALALGRLAEGELWMDGQRFLRLPLPYEGKAAVRARLAFANGVVLEIQADRLACPLSGNEIYTASYAC